MMVRLPLEIQNAYAQAAAKNLPAAERLAQNAALESSKLGLFRIELEATLALGEIEMLQTNRDAGRKRLAATEKAARARGFEFIARKANAARQSVSVQSAPKISPH
jgi:hypothetical protein